MLKIDGLIGKSVIFGGAGSQKPSYLKVPDYLPNRSNVSLGFGSYTPEGKPSKLLSIKALLQNVWIK